MTHPTVVAALAAERHADLLRAAETRRRTADLTRGHRRPSRTRPAEVLNLLAAAFRARVAASTRPHAEPCCA